MATKGKTDTDFAAALSLLNDKEEAAARVTELVRREKIALLQKMAESLGVTVGAGPMPAGTARRKTAKGKAPKGKVRQRRRKAAPASDPTPQKKRRQPDSWPSIMYKLVEDHRHGLTNSELKGAIAGTVL